MNKITLLGAYLLGGLIRCWLSVSEYQKVVCERKEISTPLNSWQRVTEGLHLYNLGIHPYSGDSLHETPLHLWMYNVLVSMFQNHVYLVFVLCDLLTAFLLSRTAKIYMNKLKAEEKAGKYAEDALDILLTEEEFKAPPALVAIVFLFNPYIIANCVGFTTTVFNNLFLALFLNGLMNDSIILSTLPLAICITQNFYAILLVSPLFIHFIHNNRVKKAFATVFVLTMFVFILYNLSYRIYGSWEFLNDTFGFTLTVLDLQPNTGLFWYFFIEMFEHFRTLFIYSFQINVTLLYIIPLSIRFRKDSMLLAVSLLCLTAIFKSYSCLGDVGFVISLLPCWKHLFNYIQQGFLVGCSFFVTTALAPTVWHLWIYSGSANANFYFGVTLAFATAQIFLITDILFAYIKREFTLVYGRVRKINGKDAQLMLE